MSSRINRTTAVGALAACAVIGATSPVWADNGPSGTSDVTQTSHADTAQNAAIIATLRAELNALEAHLHNEGIALDAATRSAMLESKALEAARTEAARWKAIAESESAPTTVPADAKDFDKADLRHHDCHHGDAGDSHDSGDSHDFGGDQGNDGDHAGFDDHGGPGHG